MLLVQNNTLILSHIAYNLGIQFDIYSYSLHKEKYGKKK